MRAEEKLSKYRRNRKFCIGHPGARRVPGVWGRAGHPAWRSGWHPTDSRKGSVPGSSKNLQRMAGRGFDTIAVICRDQKQAQETAELLQKELPVMPWDPEKASFEKGIMVFPVEYTKGLEFDAVLLLDPDRESYPTDDGHAKLLYVAATRALHRLEVLHTGNLTGLIADPIPKRTKSEYPARRKRSSSAESVRRTGSTVAIWNGCDAGKCGRTPRRWKNTGQCPSGGSCTPADVCWCRLDVAPEAGYFRSAAESPPSAGVAVREQQPDCTGIWQSCRQ